MKIFQSVFLKGFMQSSTRSYSTFTKAVFIHRGEILPFIFYLPPLYCSVRSQNASVQPISTDMMQL